MRAIVQRILPVTLTAAFISACADAPTSSVPFSPSLHVVGGPITTPPLELVLLCKVGPAGTYTFDATATDPVLRDAAGAVQTAATYTIVVSAGSTIDVGGSTVQGACFSSAFHDHIAVEGGDNVATVTVVETGIPAGVDFQKVEVYQNTSGTVTMSSSTTNSASGQVGGPNTATLGASIVFYNVIEPTGGEGCTPGYWKNHDDSWAATGYSPAQTLESVFDVPDAFNLDNVTLLQALSLSGGPGALGAAKLLLHHAVAALLNAAHPGVEYDESVADIIADVNAALATGSRDSMLALKTTLDELNNSGCPLN